MKSLRPAIGIALAFSLSGATANPIPQAQVSFTPSFGSAWNADWNGVESRVYFAQWSLDLAHWEYLPVVEFGSGLKGTGMETTGAAKFFFRIVYLDGTGVANLEQARDADFDGDGIPNSFEVEELGSNPLDSKSAGGDTDSDGMSDGWELYYFGGVGIANPGTVSFPNGDGLTNKEKSELGLNPNMDYASATSAIPFSYAYDDAGRLTGVTAPVGGGAYTSDEEGNITGAQ